MSTSRSQFNTLNSQYRLAERVKRFYNSMTYSIILARIEVNSDLILKLNDIVITTNFTFIPKKYISEETMDCVNELMDGLMFDYKAEYTCKDFMINLYDPDKILNLLIKRSRNLSSRSMEDNDMYKFKTSTKDYFIGMMSSNLNRSTLTLRFMMSPMEKAIFMRLIEKKKTISLPYKTKMTTDNMDNYFNTAGKVFNQISQTYDEMFEVSRVFVEPLEFSALEEYVTSIRTISKEELSYKSYKLWERCRHDIFGMVFMSTLKRMVEADEQDWSFEEETSMDIDIWKKFEYTGPGYDKTPDQVMRRTDLITGKEQYMIVDFAVTTGSPQKVRTNKRKKYDDLRAGLTKHLSCEVLMDAVVLKISGEMEIQIPPQFSRLTDDIMTNENILFLKEVQLTLQTKNNYEEFRKRSDDENRDIESENMLFTEPMKKMMTEKLKFADNISHVKTQDMSDSRSDKNFMNKKKVEFGNSNFKKILINYNSPDHSQYSNKVLSTLSKMSKENTFPERITRTCELNIGLIKNQANNIMKKMELIRENHNKNMSWKIPKLFKYPIVNIRIDTMPREYKNYTPTFWEYSMEMTDGTKLLKSDLGFKDLDKVEMRPDVYSGEGIGANFEEDFSIIDSVMNDLMSERVRRKNDSMSDLDDTVINTLRSKKLWDVLEFYSDMVQNICYLEGRRSSISGLNGVAKSSTVFKNFGQYMILVKRGSKLTSQKQIRFKIICHKDAVMYTNNLLTHTMREMEIDERMVESKWLAISVTDIRHFIRVKEVAISILSDSKDKASEMMKGNNFIPEDLYFNKSYMTMMMVMLEHKRGTSTSLQLNRYLLHSATSYITDRIKQLNDIGPEAIRSRLESYIRMMQLKWYVKASEMSMEISADRISKLVSSKTDYDRFRFTSFYDLDMEVEFSVLMNEIYTCNLFDKESGFTEHRAKQIVDKMMTEEIHFQEVKKTDWSQGIINDIEMFFKANDDRHLFDRDFISSATKFFFEKTENKLRVASAIESATSSTIEAAMMMSSSLKSGPLRSEALEFSEKIVKEKTFINLFKEVSNLSTHMLQEMCNTQEFMDAVFTIFPKSQIGGPREILIMSIKTRVMVKFYETIAKELCKIHPKEMLTKDRSKAELQSSVMNDYRQMMKNSKKSGLTTMVMSFNSDASRWAPGFVMEHNAYMINEMELPEEIKTFMMTVNSAFSDKKILIPEMLKNKWDRKPTTELDFSEGVQAFREQHYKNGGVSEISSGMGQGMLHFWSSFYHAIIDDYTDYLLKENMMREHSTMVDSVTMLSSDDKTKMILMTFMGGPKDSEAAVRSYVMSLDCISRLGNIHINWKKSGMNFLICEFNSLFSIGKRMCWATLKDLYTAHLMPDLTCPEEAVSFMISNIRRCFEHGVFLPTLELMMKMARSMIKKFYKYDNEVIDKLCKMLDVKEEMLPFSLGFVPTTYIFETLIMGPEIHMFHPGNSDKLTKFFWNINSAKPNVSMNRSKKVVPFAEASMGKYWFELPTRLDKKLKEIKDEFFQEDLKMPKDKVMNMMNRDSLNVNLSNNDMKKYENFAMTYFVGMNRKYEFQETMVVHSLVRALQMTNKKGMMYPKTHREEDLLIKIKELEEDFDFKMRYGFDATETAMQLDILKKEAEDFNLDIIKFTDQIMSLNEKTSSIILYSALKDVIEMADEIQNSILSMPKSTRNSHPRMCKMNFYMSDNIIDVKPQDILNYMFEPESDVRNMTIMAFEDVVKTTTIMKSTDCFENPFKFIEDIMGNTDMPFKSFIDFLSYNFKSFKNLTINMISDEPDIGNFKDNLITMYRTKSDPSFVYDRNKTEFAKDQTMLEFLTNISLDRDVPNLILDESMMTIKKADNAVIESMKLMSCSNSEFTTSKNITYGKVKYRATRTTKFGSKTIIKSWSNLNLIIKSFEEPDKAKIYITSSGNIDTSSDNSGIMSVFNRYITELRNMRKEVIFMNKESISEFNNLTYNIRDLKFRTYVKWDMVNWYIILQVTSSEEKDNRKLMTSSDGFTVRVMSDNYTVDNKTLMEMKVDNGYGDQISLANVLTETPPLEVLEKIFMRNKWLKKIEINESGPATEQDRFSVDMMSAAFGSAAIGMSMRTLYKVQAPEVDNNSMNNENDTIKMNTMNVEVYSTIRKAFEKANDNSDEQSESNQFSITERSSVIKYMDTVTTLAINQELDINKAEIANFYNYVKVRSKGAEGKSNMSAFHNMLYNQILEAFDYNISDAFAVILYNCILKRSMSSINVKPHSSLKKMSREMVKASSIKLVSKRFEKEIEYDKMLENFMTDE